MNKTNKQSGLQIDHDPGFERRVWKIERVGWGLMGGLVAAALLGLFGSGPLSRASAGDESGPIWIEYDRFQRYQAPARLRIHLGAGTARGREVAFWIARAYLDRLQVRAITPQPIRVESGADRYTFVFSAPEPALPTAVTFDLQTEAIGALVGTVGLAQAAPLTIRQFVYP